MEVLLSQVVTDGSDISFRQLRQIPMVPPKDGCILHPDYSSDKCNITHLRIIPYKIRPGCVEESHSIDVDAELNICQWYCVDLARLDADMRRKYVRIHKMKELQKGPPQTLDERS